MLNRMKKGFSGRCGVLLIVCLNVICMNLVAAQSQGDEVDFAVETGVLSYELSYERALANAEARNCQQDVFENGLIHSVLRTLFLYLPLEASYFEGVERLEVRVLSEEAGGSVLYATADLDTLRQTNSQFRVFMNSFASTRTGACFAVPQDTLQQWLTTLAARGGEFAADKEVVTLALDNIISLDELSAPLVEAEAEPEIAEEALEPPTLEESGADPASVDTNVETDEATEIAEPEVAEPEAAEPEAAEPEAADTEETATAEAETEADAEAPADTEFQVVPPLSEERRTEFEAAEPVLEQGADYAARIETTKGTLVVDLFEEQAPVTVNNFVFLALNNFYDGLPFHRVLEDFMAQTGDPLGSGAGGPGYQFPDEISPDLNHSAAGVVSMANAGPDSNGSQFFITLEPTPWLDGQYSVFGAVIEGVEILDELRRTDPNAPIAVATLDTTLGLLETQNVDFAGGDSFSFETYLIDELGAVPPDGERFTLADYDVLIATDPNTSQRLLAFWDASDKIVSVEIVRR